MPRLLTTLVVTLAATIAVMASPNAQRGGFPGAVYVASNRASGNEILVFQRGADGQLSFEAAVPTGGLGTGSGLGNQGGVRLSADNRLLLVVNAGSNDVSVFEVNHDGIVLRDRANSGGARPISVTLSGRLVYVLNAGGRVGGTDNVTGFRLSRSGELIAIPGSSRGLSAADTDPAQVELSRDGNDLVVTEKMTNLIDVFSVNDSGMLGARTPYVSAGPTPFGFAFGKRGQFFVTEAAGGAPNASSVSSYHLPRSGPLEVVSAAVPTTETAACWAAVSGDGRFVYVTNTGSGSISGFSIRPNGRIALLDADGVTASTGPGSMPIDLAFSAGDRFLYALNSGTQSISTFRARDHGELAPAGTTTGLPAGANGLAAR
jgi:6-phosphogluconolactonase (cycloisomerase 2 family)